MRIWRTWATLLTAAALMMALCASAASAAPTGSCKRDSATPSHYDCQFYTAGNGISAGSPVVDVHGSRLGYLNGGTNFVDCQKQGSEYPSSGASVRNDWWAWTEANDDKWGWVSAYWASGGSNDEKFSGVPPCPSSMGSAPIVGSSPAPPPPKPAPSAPAPVPCSPSGGHYFCTFWPAGDGISAGAPVTDGSGNWIGYLNHGRNFVDCQEYGGNVALGSSYNHYWAWTEADNHKWGWVSALFGQGGANDGTFQGVPSCDVQRVSPPAALRSTGPGTTAPRPTPTPAPKPKPTPDPTSCAKRIEGQTATVTFRVRTSRYMENVPVSGDGEPSARYYLENPKMRNFGQVVIHGYTCKSPRGWTIGRTMSIEQSSVGLYPGASDAPTPRGSGETEGWGVGITGVRNGVMTVKAMACTTDTGVGWFGIVQKISGLIPPIKGLWYGVSVVKYAIGQIPTSGPKYTTHCGDLGDDHLYISVDHSGHLRVTAPSAEQWMQGIYENPHDPGPGGSYEYHVHEETIFDPVIRVKS